jgi:hypothetical protein
MEKKRSRISWKKEFDHEVGEETKEKGWKSMEKRRAERLRIKILDGEEGDELKKQEGA